MVHGSMQSSCRLVFLAAASTTFRARGLTNVVSRKVSIATLSIGNPTPSETKMAWCRTASVQPGGEIALETIADGVLTESDQSTRIVGGQAFDLTQSVDWMEYLEKIESRENDEGGAGAYDTMRCDVILSKEKLGSTQNRVQVWGQDYHLQRLQKSYLSLLHAKKFTSDLSAPIEQNVLKEAMGQSNKIISELLASAESSVQLTESSEEDTLIQLFRVTLLWSSMSPGSTEATTNDSILVRGHATSSCKPMKVHQAPEPIVVSIAAHSTDATHDDEEATVDTSLPTRYSNPQSKIASWCRQRKQLEKAHYKPPDASEVLMVRPRRDEAKKSRLEVLEGLSSNFFAIYMDGTLRTATEGVLHGYVRHLVLDCASSVGLKFDPRPIFLHDANEWQEAFITSSSRLIYPISKVLLPEEGKDDSNGNSFVEYWKYEPTEVTPKWQELLQEILKAGGYQELK